MDILINNEVKSLTIIDLKSGCEWTQDLIGNADEFDGYDDNKEMYTMTQEAYKWWENYISVEQDLQYRIQVIRDSNHSDVVDDFDALLIAAGSNDYETMQSNVTEVVEQYENNLS